MAGIADSWKLNNAASAAEAQKLCEDLPGVKYARLFAECDGRGSKEEDAYAEMVKQYGEGHASSLQAICWFLHWGSYTGNTLNGMLGFKKGKDGMSLRFKAPFLIYYGPLFFGLINFVSLTLKVAPKVPAWFSAFFGTVLATIAGSFFFPLGVIGKIVGAKVTKKE